MRISTDSRSAQRQGGDGSEQLADAAPSLRSRRSELSYPSRVRFVPPLKLVLVLLIIGGLFVLAGVQQLFDGFKPGAGWTELLTGIVLLALGLVGVRRYLQRLDEIAGDFSAKNDIRRTPPWERKTKL